MVTKSPLLVIGRDSVQEESQVAEPVPVLRARGCALHRDRGGGGEREGRSHSQGCRHETRGMTSSPLHVAPFYSDFFFVKEFFKYGDLVPELLKRLT